jgi:hypothetical protein
MTNHEACLNEFRDASALVRMTFAALSEAREVQIIANRTHADANEAYIAAQRRLDIADAALIAVRADAPVAADIDTTRMPAPFGVPFNRMFDVTNGAASTEQAD